MGDMLSWLRFRLTGLQINVDFHNSELNSTKQHSHINAQLASVSSFFENEALA